MSDFIADLKFAFRRWAKNPGSAAIALIILVLGIGANTAIFSFLDAVVLKPLPYPEPERIVSVAQRSPDNHLWSSPLNYLDWEKQQTVFEEFAAETGADFTLVRGDAPKELHGSRVRAHYFDIFRSPTLLGRTFAAGEDDVGRDHEAILSYHCWTGDFGGDPNLIGQTISLNNEAYTVIGVFRPHSAYDRSVDLWVPLSFPTAALSRDNFSLTARARLKPGVTIEQARAAMNTLADRLAQDFPETNRGWTASVEPLSSLILRTELKQALYLLFVTTSLILLIACANLASLSLAQGFSRQREVAIRASLGASRGRIIRQFFTENLLLCSVGGGLGIVAGWGTLIVLQPLIPAHMFPAEAEIRLDGRVLLFALAMTGATAVLSGVVPAFHSTRLDLAGAAKQSGPTSSSDRAGRRLRGLLVIIEVAVAFVLLACTGLLLRSFAHMRGLDVALDPQSLVIAYFPISAKDYPEPPAVIAYAQAVEAQIRQLPGVQKVSITSAVPLTGWGWKLFFTIAGHPAVERSHRPISGFKAVEPAYFSTVGMRLIQGRLLQVGDHAGSARVMVINDSMAKKYFPGENPLGQHVLTESMRLNGSFGPDVPWEVVGVVTGEINQDLTDRPNDEGMYVPWEQNPVMYPGIVMRTDGRPELVERALPRAVQIVNRSQSLTYISTLEAHISDWLGLDRLRSTLLSIFAGLALILTIVGLYGVLSCSVAQRTREIGIRSALGATGPAILRLVVREGVLLIAAGLLVGFLAALSFSSVLASLLIGVGARDPLTMILAAAMLLLCGTAACLIPAVRATKVSPLIAMQAD